jgi:lysophospholipase L1-like esterase
MRSLRFDLAALLAASFVWACSNGESMYIVPMTGAGTGAAGTGVPGAAGAGVGAAGSTIAGAAGMTVAAAAAGTGVAGSTVTGTAGRAGSAAAGSGGAAGTPSMAVAGMMAAAAGSGGAAGAAAGAPAPAKLKPPCLKKASQVVFIGDSYIEYAVAHQSLNVLIEKLAVAEGKLTASDHYRTYAAPGTALAAPNLLGMIPPQWDQAVAEDPDIKFVIMDGGGNDVLIDNMQCLAAGSDKDPGCQMVVAETLRVGSELINKMKAGGVTDGIYFFYPHVPTGGDDINDYSLAMLKSTAMSLTTPAFRTYVVDTIPIFEGHEDWFSSDGIHANDTGEQKIADEIWKLMKDNCIAQPASSDCCTP